jgi:hypothetical protein
MTQALWSKSPLLRIADWSRRGLVRFRMVALIPILVLVAGCSPSQGADQWNNLANIEVDASRIPYLVKMASEGDARSFDELGRASAALDRAVASVESVHLANGTPWLPKSAWTQLRNSIQSIQSSRDQLLGGFESSTKVAGYFQSVEQTLMKLVQQLPESEKSATRVYILMNSVVALERLTFNSQRFMKMGKDVEATGDRLARDAAYVDVTLRALRSGNDELGVRAESDAASRAALDGARQEFENAYVHIGTMLDAMGVLQEVMHASSQIEGQAGIVADSARAARIAENR